MKGIAYILVWSMVLLGVNRFSEPQDQSAPETEMACDMDCCVSHDNCCGDKTDQAQDDKDHQCPVDCKCDCSFHPVAIAFHFGAFFGIAPLKTHYAAYCNSYHFEYSTPLFQPPRFS